MTQQRQTKTSTYIKEAVSQLLQKEAFESISVTAICRTAGINRGTFYLHFLDKYDMMDQFKNQTLGHFHAILADSERIFSSESIQEALDYIQDNRAFFQALAHSSYVNLPQASATCSPPFLTRCLALTAPSARLTACRPSTPRRPILGAWKPSLAAGLLRSSQTAHRRWPNSSAS